jgi:hypothetical protein
VLVGPQPTPNEDVPNLSEVIDADADNVNVCVVIPMLSDDNVVLSPIDTERAP